VTATVAATAGTGRALVLDLPPDFHEIPLAVAVEDRAAAQAHLVERLGLADPAQREGVALFVEALARSLADGPVLATSFCAVRLRGAPSTATLTVATMDVPATGQLVASAAVAETLRRRGVHGEVGVERAGPHVVAVALHDGQVTVAVPVPDEPLVAVVAVTTASPADVPVYRRVALAVAGSLRLERA
jgi:hypothetical protein